MLYEMYKSAVAVFVSMERKQLNSINKTMTVPNLIHSYHHYYVAWKCVCVCGRSSKYIFF